MQTSCIIHPKNEKFIIIRPWQISMCKGNACAAALLSYFEYWHNFKIQDREKKLKLNSVAEQHGDKPIHSTNLMQFHTSEDFEAGLLIYKKDSIRGAIKLLEDLGLITTHENPNPRYKFDKTKYFIFHPEKANEYIENPMWENSSIVVEKSSTVEGKPQMVEGKPTTVVEKPTSNNIDTIQDTFTKTANKESITEATAPVPGQISIYQGSNISEDQGTPSPAAPPLDKKKKGVELTQDEKPLYTPMMDIYFKWHEKEAGCPPIIDKGQGEAMKKLIKYFYSLCNARAGKEAQAIPVEEIRKATQNSWQLILANLSTNTENGVDKFYKTQNKLTQIFSNITNIINQLKNERDNKNNGKQGGKRGTVAVNKDDAAVNQEFSRRFNGR